MPLDIFTIAQIQQLICFNFGHRMSQASHHFAEKFRKTVFPTPILSIQGPRKINDRSTVNWKILENRITPVPGYSLVLLLLDCRVILGPGKGAGGARGCAPVGQHQGSVGRLEHLAHVPAHGRDVTVVRPRFFRVRLVLSTAALESML